MTEKTYLLDGKPATKEEVTCPSGKIHRIMAICEECGQCQWCGACDCDGLSDDTL